MSSIRIHNETVLLQRIASGDERSFTILYEHYYPYLSGYVLKYVKSSFLAEDIVQEVFLKIWEARESLVSINFFGPYLFTIAKNHTINILKAASKSETALAHIRQHYSQINQDVDERINASDYFAFIQKQIEALPERTRQIFMLCREEGKTYDEVARDLGISRNAVKNHMVYSRKVLRDAVNKEFGLCLPLLLTFFNF